MCHSRAAKTARNPLRMAETRKWEGDPAPSSRCRMTPAATPRFKIDATLGQGAGRRAQRAEDRRRLSAPRALRPAPCSTIGVSLMRDSILVHINGVPHNIGADQAFETLARFLRDDERATGTKIVCEEGDCGACTVLIGRKEHGELRY